MKNISIYIALLLVQFCSLSLFAQEKKQLVTARVVNEDNKPIPGVIVKSLENPTESVMTGVDGAFSFEAAKNESLELTINSMNKVVVTPNQADTTFVINSRSKTVDYGFGIRHNQLESTASVSRVDYDILQQSGEINPANTLFGRLLGLSVMQSPTMDGGYPFASGTPAFFIRGKGTYQTASPLVLVDGVARPLIALSVDEIESVEVLKDAPTLALYGQFGANGVMSIRTKRGNFNTPREVKASYQYAALVPVSLPKMVNGVGYANAVNEARLNDGLDPMYSDYDINDIQQGNYPYLLPNVNWFNEALRSYGDRQIANVLFRGGGSNVAYFANLNYSDERGLYKPVNDNRGYTNQLTRKMMSASLNLDIKVTKTTNVSVNMYGNLAEFNRPGLTQDVLFGYLYQLPPTAFPIRAENGKWGGSLNPAYAKGNLSINPVAQISGTGYATNNQNRLGVDGVIKQDLSSILPGLSADVRVGTDNVVENLDTKNINNFPYTAVSYTRDPDTHAIPDENILSQDFGAEALMTLGGSLKSQYRHSMLYAKVNYDKAWSGNVITGSIGYTHEKSVGDGQYSTLLQESLFGQAHYVRDQKYIVDLAMSYSGTNLLQAGDHFRFYPALSVAWILSEENFMKDSKTVDFLKLRGSFGYSGNSMFTGTGATDYTLYIQGFVQGGGYTLGDANVNNPGRIEQKMATPDLSPELSRTGNLGLDYSLWKKLSGSIDVFYSYRTRILADGNNSVTGVFGAAGPYVCKGIVSNMGGEIGINWMDQKGDFKYLIGGQFSYARNKIINMEEAYKQYDYMKNTGLRVGQPFGLQAIGFFKDQADIDASVPQSWGAPSPGDIKYKDQNGDGVINANDVVALASPTGYPDMYFSLALGLEWKGFGINALFQGAAKYGINLNTPGTYWGLMNDYTISQYMYDNSWSSIRNTPALFPRLTTQQNSNNYRNNSIWIIDDSFVKLRNVEVYYLLPKSLLSKLKINNAKLSLKGSNIVSFDKLAISDPEFIGANYPILSSYSAGISFNF